MIPILLVAVIVLLLVAIALLGVLLRRQVSSDPGALLARLDVLEKLQERGEKSVVDALVQNRQESAELARAGRDELQQTLQRATESLVQSVDRISNAQQLRLEDFATRLNALRQAGETSDSQLRQEVGKSFTAFRDSLQKQVADMSVLQKQQFDSFAANLTRLTEAQEKKSDELRLAMEAKLAQLQADNAAKLEEMRRTVDEKLQGTLEKRLGESFKLVSERLEQVHKGLGEMQTLATGVGDLKRVLTNVKTRGTWGEVQLGNLLEQIMAPEQFARNVQTKPNSREVVEYAIRLPGRDDADGKEVLLPIDAKFPKEDYERLVDAAERSDAAAVEQAGKDLELRVRAQARDIRDKYLAPPHTTDFGILYLPTEGLYAEIARRPGLADGLQRDYRVLIVGPMTLAALLNSLQMGFRTLAIQKRSSEVWKVLGAVKTEFGKFGDTLERVKKKLDETGSTIDDAVHRSRQLERKLKKVEALPAAEAAAVLGEGAPAEADSDKNEI